jgi:hypothetical protein
MLGRNTQYHCPGPPRLRAHPAAAYIAKLPEAELVAEVAGNNSSIPVTKKRTGKA